jgi:hypothetical protein
MRHAVNFGLLFAFLSLATTGVMAFVLPFSLTTTRVHIVAGLLTLLLVLMHALKRMPYFKRQLAGGAGISRGKLATLALLWVLVVAGTYLAIPPSTWLMNQGYEARNRAQIVRTSSLVGFGTPSPHRKLIVRSPQAAGSRGLSLYASFPEDTAEVPAIAVWAETTAGTLVETLYLPEPLSFADKVEWQGSLTQRNHILPIWRNRFTAVSGIGPDGEVDATSGATDTHSFALDPYLVTGEEQKFVICVEVNVLGDRNETWDDAIIGQPSLLYTAYVETDGEQAYAILELTGHGGDAENNGNLQYDLEGFTSAKTLVDLLLIKLEQARD